MSFPFLGLPPELRNHVYRYAITDLKKGVKLKLTPRGAWYRRGYLALTTICKQIRAEFQPLFMNNVKFKIRLQDMPNFLTTFFHETIEQIPRPLNVTFVNGPGVETDAKWDMRLFFLAKAQTRGLKWNFVYPDNSSHVRRRFLPRRAGSLVKYLNAAACLPQGFGRDIERGYISAVTLQHSASRYRHGRDWPRHIKWMLTVSKEAGGLQNAEKARFGRYCELLFVEGVVGLKVHFTVLVCNLKGEYVKEYEWLHGHGLLEKLWT